MNRDKKGKYSFSNMELMCKCGHRLGRHTAEYPHDCCYGEGEDYNQTCSCERFKTNNMPTTEKEESSWEKLRERIVKEINDLVSSEISRVHEEQVGAIRKDGGRFLNVQSTLRIILQDIYVELHDQKEQYQAELIRKVEGINFLEDITGKKNRELVIERYRKLKDFIKEQSNGK